MENAGSQKIKLAAGVIPSPGKIVAGVAMLQGEEFKLLAVDSVDSCEMAEGVPLNFPAFSSSIKEVIDKVTNAAGVEMFSVSAGISGGEIMGLNSRGAIYVGKESTVITEEDVSRVVQTAGKIELPSDRMVLQVLPVAFSVDNKRSLDNPVGMEGYRLECEAHVITAAVDSIESLRRAILKAGWKLESVFYDGWASLISSIDEKDKGKNLLIDIGEMHSDVVLAERRKPIYTTVMNFGLKSICSSLSRSLNISRETARKLLFEHGHALLPEEMLLEAGIEISVDSAEGFPATTITTGEICEELNKQLEGFLANVSRKLSSRELLEGIDSVVFAGFARDVKGMVELGRQVFKAGSRNPRPKLTEEFKDKYMVDRVAGLLKLTLQQRASVEIEAEALEKADKPIGKIKTWLKDFFS